MSYIENSMTQFDNEVIRNEINATASHMSKYLVNNNTNNNSSDPMLAIFLATVASFASACAAILIKMANTKNEKEHSKRSVIL